MLLPESHMGPNKDVEHQGQNVLFSLTRLRTAGRQLWSLTMWSVGKGLHGGIALRHGPETQTFACGCLLLAAL